MAEQEAGALLETRGAILSCYVIPPPITSETLCLKQRGRMEPEPYSYDWWRRLGFDSALAGSAARAFAAPATEKDGGA